MTIDCEVLRIGSEERFVLHSLITRNCNVSEFVSANRRQFCSLQTEWRLGWLWQGISIFALWIILICLLVLRVVIQRLFWAQHLAVCSFYFLIGGQLGLRTAVRSLLATQTEHIRRESRTHIQSWSIYRQLLLALCPTAAATCGWVFVWEKTFTALNKTWRLLLIQAKPLKWWASWISGLLLFL